MKKILVTGAGGYIGRHVVKELIEMGIEVIATDLYIDGIDSRAKIIKLDIFNNDKDIFEKLGRPDACMHMAWKDGFVHNSESHIELLYAHYNFIKNMVQSGLKQIAVMGSMHEIGYYEGAINENTPTNPTSMYGIAKDTLRRSLEVLFKDKNIIFQWLRCYYIYGDDNNSNSIFGKIVRADKEGKEKFPFTTGKNKYDFISISELAKQLSCCVVQEEVKGIINCCTGIPISLSEAIESFIKNNDLKIKLEYGVFPDREYDSPAVWGDNEKINLIMNKYTREI